MHLTDSVKSQTLHVCTKACWWQHRCTFCVRRTQLYLRGARKLETVSACNKQTRGGIVQTHEQSSKQGREDRCVGSSCSTKSGRRLRPKLPNTGRGSNIYFPVPGRASHQHEVLQSHHHKDLHQWSPLCLSHTEVGCIPKL